MSVTYNIYRDGSLIANVPGNLFDDSGLTNGTPYSYRVSRLVSGVEGPFSNTLVLTPSAVTPPTPPSFPTGTSQTTAMVLTGQHDMTVSGYYFHGIAGQPALQLVSCARITVTDCDFQGNCGDIYAVDSTDIVIDGGIRAKDTGDGTIGSGHSNVVQFNRVAGTISAVRGLQVYGGNTEDMVSIFDSGGDDSSHPIIVENCAFESPLPPDSLAWSSGSGSGTMVESGTHVVVQNNTYLNVGQGGLGFNGGTDVRYLGNILYGAQRTGANVGLYGLPLSSGLWIVQRNRVWWKNASGSLNSHWKPTSLAATGWSTDNTWDDTTINPADLVVVL